MQRPIELIYPSLILGNSMLPLRNRYYTLFPFILRHYEENIRHPDPKEFRKFQRRCEALFALSCTHGEAELGITGSDRATKRLNEVCGDGAVIDFSLGVDADADEGNRYLRYKGDAIAAV